jgi:hypothetical protein
MHFAIVWTGPVPLEVALARPIREIALHFGGHREPHAVTLIHDDGTGIRIASTMHDVAEQREIGSLLMTSVPSVLETTPRANLKEPFSSPHIVEILTIEEEGSTADSGVALRDSNGTELIIVSAAFPYCIHIHGLLNPIPNSAAEYPLKAYTRRPLLIQ